MTVALSSPPILQFFNNLGQPNSGGSILTQVGGSNYATYQDSAGATPLPNPIPLNSRGEISNSVGTSCQLFLTTGVTYTFTMYDANGNQLNQATVVAPISNVTSVNGTTSGSVVVAATGANSDITSLNTLAAINSGPLYGNRIKNANKLIAQRATSGTITAGTTVPTASTGYYTVDRFYQYCTGANVAVAQVAGSDNTNNRVQYTGAASVTAIGHGTRLEASETAHMANNTCTYSAELANSLLTTVTWTAYYATTKDTFGTVGTPTKTQIATGTFTVTSTVTKYSTQIALPAGATTGIEIVLTVGAQTSGTWTVGREDFRLGSVSPTVFEVPDAGQELARCQRYYEALSGICTYGYANGASASVISSVCFKVTKRVTPTVVTTSDGGTTNFTSGGISSVTVNGYGYQVISAAAGVVGALGATSTASAEL